MFFHTVECLVVWFISYHVAIYISPEAICNMTIRIKGTLCILINVKNTLIVLIHVPPKIVFIQICLLYETFHLHILFMVLLKVFVSFSYFSFIQGKQTKVLLVIRNCCLYSNGTIFGLGKKLRQTPKKKKNCIWWFLCCDLCTVFMLI
jgi:hypothetical protein